MASTKSPSPSSRSGFRDTRAELFPYRDGHGSQLRRHRPARPALSAPDRAASARRAARIRVRLDLRLARPVAGVHADPRARGGGHRADQARPHGHEPRHARADRGGQRLRDAPGHLGRPHGDGHRARRLRPALHQPEAGAGRPLRGGHPDDQAVHERREGALERHRSRAHLGAPRAAADRDARGRLRPARARRSRGATATA